MAGLTLHLGLVAPLPPAPTGVAEWVATALPLLEQHAQVSCFVPDPLAVDEELRKQHRIRPLDERHDPAVDMLIYHIGNNPHHDFVVDALIEGPAGLVEVHDASLHHHLQEILLGKRRDHVRYVELGEAAHGWAGRRLAQLRWFQYRGDVEMFLYDYLQPVLDRSRGVIVHSKYAEELVQLRCPRVHTWIIPLHAPELPPAPSDRSWSGIDNDTLLVAHLGFVTLPKRADVYLQALRQVLDRGLKAHLVFAGQDATNGVLRRSIGQLELDAHVTVTGYLELVDMVRWVQAVDAIVNLRAPHVGESSGSLAYGLAAGKPVIVQPIGSWAELPPDVVVRMPVTDDDATVLADILFALGQDSSIRERFGERAREFAQTELEAHRCVELLVQAVHEAAESNWTPPSWTVPGRVVAARTFLESGAARIESLLAEDSTVISDSSDVSDSSAVSDFTVISAGVAREALSLVTPARPHGKLLAIDAPPRLVQLLANVWGYEVDARTWGSNVQSFELDSQPGVAAYSYQAQSIDLDDLELDHFDVIVSTSPGDELLEFLARCNQTLTSQGLVVVLQAEIDVNLLDLAGLSPHQHVDHPGWAVRPPEKLVGVTMGIKATIPATAVG